MPIPFILGGAAALAGALGIKKGVDAYSDNQRAEELYEEAQDLFEAKKTEMEHTREATSDSLADLGALKLQIWGETIWTF